MNLKAIKRAIILCWVLLAVCFAIKLFGGNWFEIVCANEHFIKFCDFIDRAYINYPLSCILIIRIKGHLTCSIFGKIPDIWDCSNEIVDCFWVCN